MNGFCVAVLHMPEGLRARQGVLRSDAFFVTDDAHRAAEQLLGAAREQAQDILTRARAEADGGVRREQQRVAQEAGRMLAVLKNMQQSVLDEAAGLAIELARLTFDRLVLDTTPEERLAAACRRVLEEAPPKLASAVAWMHPDDAAAMAGAEALPWEIRSDKRLLSGSCRLEAANGEWRAEFGLAAEALQASLAQFNPYGATADTAPQDGEEDVDTEVATREGGADMTGEQGVEPIHGDES